MYSIVFIDLDGTITESKPGIVNGLKYALEEIGHALPPDDLLDQFIGPPLVAAFEEVLGITGKRAEDALAAYRVYYARQGEFESSLYEGVEEMLKALKDAGKRLFIVTSKPQETAEQIISHFALDEYFEQIYGASLDHSRDTKLGVIRYAIEDLKAEDLSQIVMVGDRKYDINGANTAGIESIGALYGYGSLKELKEAGAGAIAESPRHIAELILGISKKY